MVKQGCWKSEDQGYQFRYHMTRKLRDALLPCCIATRFNLTTCMQLAPDWNRDAFTRGNFSPGGEMLESRRGSPQNTRVAAFVDGSYGLRA
jgi:hypothetical protein